MAKGNLHEVEVALQGSASQRHLNLIKQICPLAGSAQRKWSSEKNLSVEDTYPHGIGKKTLTPPHS